MALTTLQNSEQIQKDIQQLARDLETLRKTYEQYFLGILRQEPLKLREQVKSLIQKHSGLAIQNVTLKFQLQQCVARYNTFTTYWDRVLHQMEEGTYQRDVFKTKLHEQERKENKAKQKTTAKSDNADGDVYQTLFNEYKTLKKQLKQDVDSLSFEKFQAQLKSKIKDIRAESKEKNLSFKIVKEGKEMKIKLQSKKEKSS